MTTGMLKFACTRFFFFLSFLFAFKDYVNIIHSSRMIVRFVVGIIIVRMNTLQEVTHDTIIMNIYVHTRGTKFRGYFLDTNNDDLIHRSPT